MLMIAVSVEVETANSLIKSSKCEMYGNVCLSPQSSKVHLNTSSSVESPLLDTQFITILTLMEREIFLT